MYSSARFHNDLLYYGVLRLAYHVAGKSSSLLKNSHVTVILEKPKATENLQVADWYDKQVLRFAQNDHTKWFFNNLLEQMPEPVQDQPVLSFLLSNSAIVK